MHEAIQVVICSNVKILCQKCPTFPRWSCTLWQGLGDLILWGCFHLPGFGLPCAVQGGSSFPSCWVDTAKSSPVESCRRAERNSTTERIKHISPLLLILCQIAAEGEGEHVAVWHPWCRTHQRALLRIWETSPVLQRPLGASKPYLVASEPTGAKVRDPAKDPTRQQSGTRKPRQQGRGAHADQ